LIDLLPFCSGAEKIGDIEIAKEKRIFLVFLSKNTIE